MIRGLALLRNRTALFVLFAIIFAASAPTISKVIASANGVTWIEVCSASGVIRIALEQSTSDQPSSLASEDTHCGYCQLQNHIPGVIGASYIWRPIPFIALHVRADISQELTKRVFRNAHPTRAPPALS